jgi:hypothetical protein
VQSEIRRLKVVEGVFFFLLGSCVGRWCQCHHNINVMMMYLDAVFGVGPKNGCPTAATVITFFITQLQILIIFINVFLPLPTLL